MPLINCEVNLILTWLENYVIVFTNVVNRGATFTTIEARLHVPVVTLSTQDNAQLPQLKSGFKRTIHWNKTRIISTKSKFKSFSRANFSRNK